MSCRVCLLVPLLALAAPTPRLSAADEETDPTVKKLLALKAVVERDTSRPGEPVHRVTIVSTKLTPDILKLLEAFPHLTYLDLRSSTLSDDGLKVVSQLPAVEFLDLGEATGFTDDGLKHVAACPKLKEVHFRLTPLTGAGFPHLAASRTLEVLQLRRMKLTDAGMTGLARVPNLKELWLVDTAVTDAGVKNLAATKSLENFFLIFDRPTPGDPISDRTLECVAGAGTLKNIGLGSSGRPDELTDDGLRHLAGLKQLEDLSLSGKKLTGSGFRHLAGGNLKRVHLGYGGTDGGITDDGLAGVAKLATLQLLNLWGNKAVSDAGLAHLKNLTNLETLNLQDTGVTGPGLAHLAKCGKLEQLNLGKAPVTDAGIDNLPALPKLTHLWLGKTKITPAKLEKLKQAGRPVIAD